MLTGEYYIQQGISKMLLFQPLQILMRAETLDIPITPMAYDCVLAEVFGIAKITHQEFRALPIVSIFPAIPAIPNNTSQRV
jgi:hypothetical protein